MCIVKVSWSGGKDSTCSLDLHLDRGDKVKAVCYVPMFTTEIPLIQKDHYQFILDTKKYFENKGAEIYLVHGITYLDHFLHRATRGNNIGRMFCFPYFKRGMCNFKRDSKLKAITCCDVGGYEYEDIGIAYDETDRQGQLTELKRSILVEEKVTEEMARKYCEERGILSPQYQRSTRDGCVLCPYAKQVEREQWYIDYPETKDLIIALQNIALRERGQECAPLRNHEWFIWTENLPNYQYTVLDYEVKNDINTR